MSAATSAALPGVAGARLASAAAPPPAAWSLGTFAGRLAEICGGRSSAALTLSFRLVLEAQRGREPVAWITRPDRTFYPPDAAAAAVDLEALVVVRASGALPAARAADQLLRSGAFGLVVLDLGDDARLPLAVLSRLAGLAQRHGTAVLCLTDRAALGSLASVRAEAERSHPEPDRFVCRARFLKDKRRGPGREHVEVRHGPDGLR